MSFLDFLYLLLITFLFVAYLMVLFAIIADLVRDKGTSGWIKALWVLLLILLPILAALVYLIVNGRKMAERHERDRQASLRSTESYIRDVAGTTNPADQVATAKGLLDSGAITPEEYERLKAKALAG